MTVVDWLLDSDPAIRWHVLRDLTDAPAAAVAATRARVAKEGVGARLLALWAADGRWRGAAWTHFAFPPWWHYDLLRGLDYLRDAGVTPDERVAEAVALVAAKRDAGGRWPLDTEYPGVMPVELDEGEGRPSRWNTLRALRGLRWAERTDP